MSRPIPWLKWIVGTLLLIPGFFSTLVIISHFRKFTFGTPTQLALITGAGIYLVMHLLLWKPVFMHVMGHELTHAFWAVILGGRIKSLLVSREGGQVTLSKTNFFIALAPYFFPIYTFLILPIYFIAAPKFYSVLAFFVGFTLAFHIGLTLHSLRDQQSDIVQVGTYFSLSFVYFMNILVLAIIISVISPEVMTLVEFFKETWVLFFRFVLWFGDIIFEFLENTWWITTGNGRA
ncbi:hypothetical protein K8S19_02610 [bacterium]|nr:hypothetical protein [bacterium]